MINPYIIAADEKDKAIIFGYVIDVKDRGDSNMLLFKKDTMDPSSDIIAVAAWGAVPGQNCSIRRCCSRRSFADWSAPAVPKFWGEHPPYNQMKRITFP